MFEGIKMMLSAHKEHLYGLRQGMADAEARFLRDEYMLSQFIDILEHRVRVGSAPMINQSKLAHNYIEDFCQRNALNAKNLISLIQEMQSGGGNQPMSQTRKIGNMRYSDIKI